MKQLFALSLLTPLLLAAHARADITPPGHRGLKGGHTVKLEGLDKLSGYTLVVTDGIGRSPQAWDSKQPLPLKYRGTIIYALEKGAAVPKAVELEKNGTAPRLRLSRITSVPSSSPIHKIETVYRITGVEGNKIQAEVVRETRFDGSGRAMGEGEIAARSALSWPVLALGLGALVVFVIVVVVRKRKQAAPAD